MSKGKSLPCQVCGEKRAFLGYGSKMGKNGKMAKWPIYEACSKKLHKANPQISAEQAATIAKPINYKKNPAGFLYQSPGKASEPLTQEDLHQILLEHISKNRPAPTTLEVHPDDFSQIVADRIAGLPIAPNSSLSPKMRYVRVMHTAQEE